MSDKLKRSVNNRKYYENFISKNKVYYCASCDKTLNYYSKSCHLKSQIHKDNEDVVKSFVSGIKPEHMPLVQEYFNNLKITQDHKV